MATSIQEKNLKSKAASIDWLVNKNDNVWDADYQYKDGVRFDNGDSYLQTNWANLARSDLEKSAKRGSTLAQTSLSHMYLEGIGVRRDPEKAFKWCAKAAQQEGQADAMYELGVMYLNGIGVTKCAPSAYRLFKSAGDHNHAEALFSLAEMQIDNSYGEVDTKLAFETCLKAAMLNLPKAQFNVGVMFEEGIGTKQSFRDSIFWYEKAACGGNRHAANNLGNMHFNGRGVPKNKDIAEHFFCTASDQGSDLANFNLAVIYSQRQNDYASILRSLKYFFMAALKGVNEANDKLKQLKKMVPLTMYLDANAKACAELSKKDTYKR